MERIDRRMAVGRMAAMTGGVLIGTGSPATTRAEPLDRELVQKFVVAAHRHLDAVKQMLTAEPHLVNATWDWGAGDFETALGGASHMARPDIARLLLESGARMDVFCAAMLGKLDVVRTCIDDNPAIVQVKGPHGISLLRHAELARQEAVIKLLQSAGAR